MKAVHGKNRRFISKALCFAAVTPNLPFAVAQQPSPVFPSKPVTIITPFAVGSGPDNVLRKVGDLLARKWGQRVVVDNRPGGGGFIAIDAAKRTPPDGYTLLLLDSEHVSALPYLYKKRGFKTLDAFDPIAVLYRTTFLIAVPTDSKWKTVGDLLASAKAATGNMTYGSWGVGSAGHLGGVMLEQLDGLKMQHIAYRDIGQLFTSVANNDVSWALATLPSSRAIFQTGKLRYLAVASPKRLPQLPNIPTVAESGGPSTFDVNSFAALMTPKGMPSDLSARINADVLEALSDRDIKATFDLFAFESLNWSGREILSQAQSKAAVYEALVQRNDISLD
jgi:tripartite-type tricarboxylate transporter receptor subunit TctC